MSFKLHRCIPTLCTIEKEFFKKNSSNYWLNIFNYFIKSACDHTFTRSMENAIAKQAHQGARGSFVLHKRLFVESFYMSSPVIKNKRLTNLRELGDTTEKYIRSKSLLKNLR